VIYRDLKPENILLDSEGYIKLADFGLAKIVNPSDEAEPNSFCGTPEYLAPEMIVGSGHDQTLDWWALGVFIYEMITGIPPFYNQNKHQMYYLIQNAPIRWPEMARHGIGVSDEAKDLITRMLEKDRKKRLGAVKDIDEILGHPWFADLNIQDILDKKMTSPYIPEVKGATDLQNFDKEVVQGSKLEESFVTRDKVKVIEKSDNLFKEFGQYVENKPKKKPSTKKETGEEDEGLAFEDTS